MAAGLEDDVEVGEEMAEVGEFVLGGLNPRPHPIQPPGRLLRRLKKGSSFQFHLPIDQAQGRHRRLCRATKGLPVAAHGV